MSSKSLHDIQKLMGCMTSLSRFSSRIDVKGLPFFKLLKKQDKFQWTKQAQEPFEDLKKYLTTPPTLVAPKPHETLQFYIFATSNVVSMMIVIERGESGTNCKIQYPFYFISEVLIDSKIQYFHIMKLAYALLTHPASFPITFRHIGLKFTHPQCSNTKRLCDRVDQNSVTTKRMRAEVLDHQFRCIPITSRGRGRHGNTGNIS
jgi:hypothetical protein